MTRKLTPEELALLNEPQIANVATVMPDGSPQVTPVWIDTDGDAVLFNTATHRVKYRNLLRDPRVAIAVVDRANPMRTVVLRGRASLDDADADAHIDKLAKKYLGVDSYPFRQADERRVVVRVVPD